MIRIMQAEAILINLIHGFCNVCRVQEGKWGAYSSCTPTFSDAIAEAPSCAYTLQCKILMFLLFRLCTIASAMWALSAFPVQQIAPAWISPYDVNLKQTAKISLLACLSVTSSAIIKNTADELCNISVVLFLM